MESIEASGRSIEDAILQALVRLGRRRDEVDVKVLQEPVRGSRGMSAREARVLVSVMPPRRRSAAIITPEMADAMLAEDSDDYPSDNDASGEYALNEADMEDAADYDAAEYGPEDEEPFDAAAYGDDALMEGDEPMESTLTGAPVIALSELLGADAAPEQVAVEALRAILAHMGL
ncbi:MAG TPA: Jag N-terminal domain-containing protein, partial [Ktedonobacterales bacterium]